MSELGNHPQTWVLITPVGTSWFHNANAPFYDEDLNSERTTEKHPAELFKIKLNSGARFSENFNLNQVNNEDSCHVYYIVGSIFSSTGLHWKLFERLLQIWRSGGELQNLLRWEKTVQTTLMWKKISLFEEPPICRNKMDILRGRYFKFTFRELIFPPICIYIWSREQNFSPS